MKRDVEGWDESVWVGAMRAESQAGVQLGELRQTQGWEATVDRLV